MTARSARNRQWRKRLTRAILCLLLGAVTTVGVAWGCILNDPYLDPSEGVTLVGGGRMFDCQEDASGGVVQRWVLETASATADPTPRIDNSFGPDSFYLEPLLLPEFEAHGSWLGTSAAARMRAGGWGRLEPDAHVFSVAAGWPLPAAWGYGDASQGQVPERGLISLNRVGQGGELFLPLIPTFPGFALDTLFYAAPWWLLLITPGAIRRLRRRRRGRCIHCGYDLTGLRTDDKTTPTCPECGSANT